ncbi:MAG TPA: ABC transporter permease [Fimbriiglobus sp.]|jgi:putative ABC transport system permease protein|nr:ABC transporter permease [Fimbriiglobus sp.]
MPPEYGQYTGQFAADTSLLELAVYAAAFLFMLLFMLTMLAVATLPVFFAALGVMEGGLKIAQNSPDPIGKISKLGGLVFRSLRRNLLRTALTYVALFVLTGMLTFLYGVVASIAEFTREKEGAQMVIMTEKFGIPSQMPPGYAHQLKAVIRDKIPPEHQPKDIEKNFMTWSFVVGSMDPAKLTQENSMFLFALQPDAIKNEMMSDHELSRKDLGEEGWAELCRVLDLVEQDKRNIVIGEDRLQMIGKKVGDEIKLYSLNYREVEFEFRIVGAFPSGSRLGQAAAMRYDYLTAKLDDYKARTGKVHPSADRCLNLIWVRMPSKAAYQQLAAVVNEPGTFSAPAVKMETFSAAVGSFLEPFKDIFWGMKWIIMPAVVVIMCLVIGITITIGVRERWTEMAVLKVLGFQPWQVMSMIVSEAMLIGVYGGMLSTWSVYYLPKAISAINKAVGGDFKFFDTWKSDPTILIAGPILGLLVGLVGAALPSWNARKVKVSEVFAQVA